MVNSASVAVSNALNSHTYPAGRCQAWVVGLFGMPGVGDRDGDGDADAVDGWISERGHQHTDRNAPAGAPVAWSGGYGHRAISLGNGLIRSTDAGGSGIVATVPLSWIEQHWGLRYLGWSDTINGVAIPGLTSAPPVTPVRETDAQVAAEVWQGRWGSGQDRVNRLRAAGYDPDAIQALVNAGVGKPGAPTNHLLPIGEVAQQVIAGKWGNGADRVRRLSAAGYNPSAVQAEVNRRLS